MATLSQVEPYGEWRSLHHRKRLINWTNRVLVAWVVPQPETVDDGQRAVNIRSRVHIKQTKENKVKQNKRWKRYTE